MATVPGRRRLVLSSFAALSVLVADAVVPCLIGTDTYCRGFALEPEFTTDADTYSGSGPSSIEQCAAVYLDSWPASLSKPDGYSHTWSRLSGTSAAAGGCQGADGSIGDLVFNPSSSVCKCCAASDAGNGRSIGGWNRYSFMVACPPSAPPPSPPSASSDTDSDSAEGTADTDGDGIPDSTDPDSDGDGKPDAEEGARVPALGRIALGRTARRAWPYWPSPPRRSRWIVTPGSSSTSDTRKLKTP